MPGRRFRCECQRDSAPLQAHDNLAVLQFDLLNYGPDKPTQFDRRPSRPALGELSRFGKGCALRCCRKIERGNGVADLLLGCKVCAQAIEYQPFDVASRDTPSLAMIGSHQL